MVRVDRDAAARYGINADEILEVVQAGIGGKAVSTLLDGARRFDIVVRLEPRVPRRARSDREHPDPHGGRRPGAARARGGQGGDHEGYTFVRREQLQRYAVIQLDVRGRDVDGFVREAEAKIRSAVKLPEGYWLDWGGAFENQQRALARLAVIVPLTIG